MCRKQILKHSLFYILLFALFSRCNDQRETRVLVFTKTAGFAHKSIPAGAAALLQLGKENGFRVDTTRNAAKFTEDTLKQYDAVVFLNTTGNVLDYRQQADFERFIQAGGGFVGIHAAADTEHHWPWYGKLVGAYFNGHPKIQKATIQVTNTDHVATAHLPALWERTDEWYNYKSINPEIKVLATLDEDTYEGGTNGEHHPIIWYHEYDGGRSFYTGLGHTNESFQDPVLRKYLLKGILWAAGEDALNYNLATSMRVPEEAKFTKNVLATGLNEPTELAVTKNGRVLLVERRGAIKLYDPATDEITVAGKLNVYTVEEDGLMGIAIDPDFEQNKWVYLYYSPAGTKAVNVLSRFVLKNGKLDMDSEKQILEVPVQREECCHTGGSIAFDAEGNLYLSTGDNTNPFASSGYAPIDGRDGRSAWDSRRSAGNTDDLRGKILRIHPEDDGTYTIPKGNLFSKNSTLKGRPEIYVMGNRNPYRISVDQKTGFLYWGEVGPDAGKDSIQGPKGHDEINQARAAGNFGWPFFIGDNKAYRQYDFASGELGESFNPEKPINHSPNNTGSKILPPPQEAFIWYPYGASKEFPLVGEGGRTAMAGPVFYSDMYQESNVKFPEYYNGKLFIYEWMRNWIMVVTMNEQGDFMKMEPFVPGMKFYRPTDMQFGSDGALYILEYGKIWFEKNKEAKLARIEYSKVANTKSKTKNEARKQNVKVEDSTEEQEKQIVPVGPSDFELGKNLIAKNDCRACHSIEKTVLGPSFRDIAARYKDADSVKPKLIKAIIEGGRGNWGDRPMAAHPQLSKEEVGKMVDYILSLTD